MINASLTPRRRAIELDALASGEQVDILVVGGGITGTAIALDAASRGLSVALVEARDLAQNTSHWPGTLTPGQPRSLTRGDVASAWEAAVERDALLRHVAPHLVQPRAHLFPLRGRTSRTRQAATRASLYADDALRRTAGTPSRLLPRPRSVPAAEALALVPGLQSSRLRGGLLSFDGAWTDAARFVVALARTAASLGARILTRVNASRVDGNHVRARDMSTRHETVLRARQVISATGIWTPDLVPSVPLRPARGSYLVLDAEACGIHQTAALIPVGNENRRCVCLLPQSGGRVHLGLTDEPLDRIPDDGGHVSPSDRDFLLDTASSVLNHPLEHEDLLGSWVDLRPLSTLQDGRMTDLSRQHLVLTDEDSGVISVVGGHSVTYRKAAENAVDTAIRAAGMSADPVRTYRLPLVGAAGRSELSTVEAPLRLVRKYGTEAPRVAALGDVDPELARPLHPGGEITAAEVAWAVRHEGAWNADDVLYRRTRLGLVPDDAAAARDGVADVVGRTLRGMGSA